MDAGPDFFVVGAPRAATTSLYHTLGRHPQIFVPTVKEPHFYAWPEVADTYYDTTFVSDPADYRALFSGRRQGQLAGDFSTSYLFRHRSASRIRADKPDARIVMVLRNPVDRALSHHRMDRRDGYTWPRSPTSSARPRPTPGSVGSTSTSVATPTRSGPFASTSTIASSTSSSSTS